MMKNTVKYTGILMLAAVFAGSLASCEEDLPKNIERPWGTELTGIRLVNAGPDQNKTVEGTVDQATKTISFPRISAKSNFAALRFEIDASEGAALEQETYDFSMDAEETEKSNVIRVFNRTRYTEYICKIGKIAPLKGADFDKAVLHLFCGEKRPDAFNYRWQDFDGRYVLLTDNRKVSMVSMEDILADRYNPIELSMEGVTPATLWTSCGQLADGHAYVASLAGAGASSLNIYYYETPASTPEKLFSKTMAEMGYNTRFGDSMNMDLDAKGNGYIFFPGNKKDAVLRLKVSGFKEIGEPVFLTPDMKLAYFYDTVTKVEGTENYIYSGSSFAPRFCDASLKPDESMVFNNIPPEFNNIRIISFNKERYMIGSTFGRVKSEPATYVYNLTKGADAKEALKIFFESEAPTALFQQPLGDKGGGNCRSFSGYSVQKDGAGKDSKLFIFGGSYKAGFFVAELPVKKNLEE